MLAAFLASGSSPYQNKKGYKSSNAAQLGKNLRRCLRGYEGQRAMDVTRELCDRMRAQAGTDTMVRANTSMLRGFLLWGYRHERQYFTPAQAELLPEGVVMPKPAIKGTRAPSRRQRARDVGQAETYIAEEDAPSAGQVRALALALAGPFPAWGELAPELAANAGPRWGEQFQLTADDVHLDGCAAQVRAHVHLDWQVDPGAHAADPRGRRSRPKGNKTRIIPVARLSFTGYRLRDELAGRVAAALAERAAGTNPQALLFPAPRGGLLWYSGFEADYLLPAMRDAGWPLRSWTEVRDVWCPTERGYRRITRQRTLAVLPWHALRHRFARLAIDVYGCQAGELMALGGWEDKATVEQRYYRSGREHTERGLALFDRG